ncbi:MAG: histidine--tRNA ligase [Thermomicrobiales bacterium]
MTEGSAAGETAVKPSNRKPQVLKGFRDYLPAQMRLRQQVIGRFREVFESHGFEQLDTPAIEYLEVLTGKAGENEKLMYAFEDHGGRRVGLRYDLTVPLARVVAMHQSEISLPFKRYHIAPVWRAEKPQRGRFREFWQCDADIAGAPSPLADAEIIAIMGEALQAVGLPAFTIQISHRVVLARIAVWAGVSEALASHVYRSVDKLAKIGRDAVLEEMTNGGIDRDAGTRILDLIIDVAGREDSLAEMGGALRDDEIATQALSELRQVFTVLPSLGITSERAVFDPTLARGLDYYTGVVFEAAVDEPRVGSVAGGGRYEELIGSFTNRSITATGVSLGLERILEVVNEFGLLPAESGSADALVVALQSNLEASAAIAREMRTTGLRIELSMQPNRSIGDQLKYAAKKGIGYAIIAGGEELSRQEVSLKHLTTGEQRALSLADAINVIRQSTEHRAQ